MFYNHPRSADGGGMIFDRITASSSQRGKSVGWITPAKRNFRKGQRWLDSQRGGARQYAG
jgi:hypothetical protein